MHWDVGPSGGLTTGTSWMRCVTRFSVAEQHAHPVSDLNHYRRLLPLRHESEALRLGGIEFVDADRSGYFAWFRMAGAERSFVQVNLADGRLQVPPVDVTAKLMIGRHTSCGAEVLAPYESRVYRWPASSAQDGGA